MTGNEAMMSVIEALEASSIPYMLVGSFSSNVYGVERSTQDADFVIELIDQTIGELARRLAPLIRVDRQLSFETVTMTKRFVANVADSPFQIEFFLLSEDPHDKERFRRRRQVSLAGREVWLPTVEDVIITKLRWLLLANRSKDRSDARDVIAVQFERIDWDYVYFWCDQHGTRALLDEIRRSIPPI
jgi:hypothetical protein